MINHALIPVCGLGVAGDFYDAVPAPLGMTCQALREKVIGD